eukprot:TRINITY_DN12075_c0_g1_i1.p1 TRINITY_DN12075_c0_g1~~TRINITY_DN12075_c0_g1_i1.p1  ORF type:complete len:288 (+),score=81.27 TRINITY_DN12075_c0_g1_i1:430-1293(+)
MAAGERKRVHLQPDDAYGPRREELIGDIDRSDVPKDAKMADVVDTDRGPARVVGLTERVVTLDANHPLAGKNLLFDVFAASVKARADKPVLMRYRIENSAGRVLMESEVARDGSPAPSVLTPGSSGFPPAFERKVQSMVAGEVLCFTLACRDAFGERVGDLVEEVPVTALGRQTVEVGQVVTDRDGRPSRVVSVSGNSAVVDGNHPLAGFDLVCNVQCLGAAVHTGDDENLPPERRTLQPRVRAPVHPKETETQHTRPGYAVRFMSCDLPPSHSELSKDVGLAVGIR